MGDGVTATKDAPSTVLWGRWLPAARASWIAVATLTLSLVTTGLVVAFNRPDLIRPPSVRAALQQAGVPDQATIVVAFIVPLAVTAAIGLLIFWRRSDDWAAMLFSLMLIAACSIPIRLDPLHAMQFRPPPPPQVRHVRPAHRPA